MRTRVDERHVEVTRQQIAAGFKELRRRGYVARMSFMCCSSCAGAALADIVGEMPEARRAEVRGVVFFHKQDDQGFRECGELYLGYGVVHAGGKEYGEPTEKTGAEVVEVMRAQGLEVEWDGSASTRILVKVNTAAIAAKEAAAQAHRSLQVLETRLAGAQQRLDAAIAEVNGIREEVRLAQTAAHEATAKVQS